MKKLIIFLSLISLLSISSALPHFTFSGIESFHDCSGEKEKVSFYIIGSLSEEVGTVTLPNYNINLMGDFQCALSKNEGEKDPARSHVITCTIEGEFEPKAYILDEPKVNGFDFLNEKGESTWPINPEKATFLIGECGERVELDKETLFFQNSERSGLFSGPVYEEPVKTIRKDVVDKALKSLPERTKTTEEVMMERMKIARNNYSLSDIEAAYMVYKWEYENLQYDCYNLNHNRTKICYREDCTYSTGVGVCDGFSRLFVSFCNATNVEAYRVVGYTKVYDYVPGVIPNNSDHAYNAIKINGNYYLLDVTWGIGSCEGDDYVPNLRDSYFCTKPEIFIRGHFPVKEEFQLVYPHITLKEFFNMLEFEMEFYENGMTGVNPDSPLIEIDDGKIKVEITHEPSDVFKGFDYNLYYEEGNTFTVQENACWINKEKTRAVFICNAKYRGNYKLQIFGGPVGKGGFPVLFEYVVHSTKNVPDLLGLPFAFPIFSRIYMQLIEPLYEPLPRGEFVNFTVRTTEYDKLVVKSGELEIELENDGNGLFTGEVYIMGTEILLLISYPRYYSKIANYSTILSPKVDVEPTYPTRYSAPFNVLYSPLLNTLKIGKSYDFKIKCKKCEKLAVLDDTYRNLTKNGDMFTGAVNITGKNRDVKILDMTNNSKKPFYKYKISY